MTVDIIYLLQWWNYQIKEKENHPRGKHSRLNTKLRGKLKHIKRSFASSCVNWVIKTSNLKVIVYLFRGW